MPLSDAEVLATFMEPRPGKEYWEYDWDHTSEPCWWSVGRTGQWVPRDITLNECREIEARLADRQWREYIDAIVPVSGNIYDDCTAFLHADASTKIEALARVLRPLVAPEEQR